MTKKKSDQVARLSLIRAILTGESLGMHEASEAPDQVDPHEAPAAPAPGQDLDFSYLGAL